MRHFISAAIFLGVSSVLSAADPLLLNLVMPDAQVVAGVNVTKAKTSPFGQFVLRQMPSDGDFAKFVSVSGFDPRRDLQEVLVASPASQKNSLVVARGTFDAAKLAAMAISDGKHKSVAYNGAQIVTSSDAGSRQAFAVFDNNFAAMGDLDAVKAAINRRKLTNTVSSQLAAKIAMYSAADAWTVSLVPISNFAGKASGTAAPGPLSGMLQGDLLKKVTESSGSVTFDSPVRLSGEFVTDTDRDATALGDVVKFLASMIQTDGGANAPVATLIQSLNVTTEGNILKLGLSIPEAQLEGLIESAPKHSGASKHSEKI